MGEKSRRSHILWLNTTSANKHFIKNVGKKYIGMFLVKSVGIDLLLLMVRKNHMRIEAKNYLRDVKIAGDKDAFGHFKIRSIKYR